MSDYISREELKKFVERKFDMPDVYLPTRLLKEAVDNFPAADVRPVVYCRDCIHRPYSSEPGKTSGFAVEAPDRECKCPCFNPDDGYYSWIPADDFFCAYGERRKEEPCSYST